MYDCASISQRRQAACLPLHVQIVVAAEATDHNELCTVCLQSKETSQALRRITGCGHTLHNRCWQRLKEAKTSGIQTVCLMCHRPAHSVDLLEVHTGIPVNGMSSTAEPTFLPYEQFVEFCTFHPSSLAGVGLNPTRSLASGLDCKATFPEFLFLMIANTQTVR